MLFRSSDSWQILSFTFSSFSLSSLPSSSRIDSSTVTQHVKNYLATARKQQEDDDLVVNVIDTPENPEEVLAELEQSLQEEDDSGWSGVTAPEEECGRVL